MPGIRMSISTTSGRGRAASADRLRAVGGLADHLDVGLGVEQRAEAGPDQCLVVGEQDPDHDLPSRGRRACDPETTARAGAGREPPPERRGAFPHTRMMPVALTGPCVDAPRPCRRRRPRPSGRRVVVRRMVAGARRPPGVAAPRW